MCFGDVVACRLFEEHFRACGACGFEFVVFAQGVPCVCTHVRYVWGGSDSVTVKLFNCTVSPT